MIKKDFLPFLLFLPLVIIGLFIALVYKAPPPEIKAVSPTDKAVDVSIYPQIYVTFSRSINKNETDKIKFNISPQVENAISWSADGKTAVLELKRSLLVNTNYKITLNYFLKKYTWEFTTQSLTNLSNEEVARLQQESDKAFTQEQQQITIDYPWYSKMPISTTDYFIAFDPTKKTFFVNLYPNTSLKTSISDQETQLKEAVIKVLEGLNVDTKKYTISWKSFPKQLPLNSNGHYEM